MIPAFITTVLWSYCVIAARRSIDQLGENAANLARILLALAVLAALAHLFGLGLGGGGLFYFFLSGVVGFGLGDIGIFYALPRLGSRLTLLMAQCLAAPIAGLAEWAWMGTTISLAQSIAVTIVLAGIVVAIIPGRMPDGRLPVFLAGTAFGVLSAAGQGMGAVLSRKAYAAAHYCGHWTGSQTMADSVWMGATAGYQRLIGGTLVIVGYCLLGRLIRSWRTYPRSSHRDDSRTSKAAYVALTAASGPIFGIICFQWALATTPSAIVQPIVALTPLVVMPMAYVLEHERVDSRAIVGALLSTGGVTLLALVS
jgi:drug/metabolite transporter (DMT)-like permease